MTAIDKRFYDQDDRNTTTDEKFYREGFEDENKVQEENTNNPQYFDGSKSHGNEDLQYKANQFSNELEDEDPEYLEQDDDPNNIEEDEFTEFAQENFEEEDDLDEDDLEEDEYDVNEEDEDSDDPETFSDDALKID